MCQLTMFNANGELCLIIVKNGISIGVTFKRHASGIKSFICVYGDYGIVGTSMEIVVHTYSHNEGLFSSGGDSGAVIGDANGCVIGMLTSCAGITDHTNVTYVTPYYFLDKQIKAVFLKALLYPIP